MRSRKVALLVSLALLLATALAVQLPSAGAQSADQTNVILIEVDGLEPKDVTPDTTPFLWELAHPAGRSVETTRAGWIWQAPRSVMTAGTAANATALLTGGYPEQSGVPADEFFDPEGGDTFRLEHQPGPDPLSDEALQIHHDNTLAGSTLLNLVQNDTTRSRDAAAFVGNPALSGIVDDPGIADTLKWWPKNDGTGGQSQPNPAYCDTPRSPPQDPSYRPPCSATDLVTLDRAASQLSSAGGDVAFTYIHLAELGVVKRRDGDFTAQAASADVDSPEAAQTVPQQLAQTDTAIAQFIQRYKNQGLSPATASKWPNTFVFVVGSHGYETSSPDKRLPAPNGQVGSSDLESWVEARGFRYSAHGSIATIQVETNDQAAQRAAVNGLLNDLKPDGSVDQACQAVGEKCIEELLFVREGVAPASFPQGTGLLSERHPNWNLDHLNLDAEGNPGAASRRSGELLIVTKPGWGAGAAVAVQPESDPPTVGAPDPYIGLAGGPRNRAVAAIVNGPGGQEGVRRLEPRRYPVTAASVNCEQPPANPTPKYRLLAEANAHPEDDTGDAGSRCQPENVDFAPTIGALLGVGIDSGQLGGRFLQEAFIRTLRFPDIEVLEEPPPPPPPPPEPEVVILPPPPPPQAPRPPATWRYSGLMRGMRATVGDGRGHPYPAVRDGAKLDYLILKADFGKPLAAVKLTFYQRVEAESAREARERGRTVVKTLATFKPFSVRRARRAKLTLKVPEIFEPTHVGVVVRRARRLTTRELRAARQRNEGEDVPDFKPYGDPAGGIYRIRYAGRLHSRG